MDWTHSIDIISTIGAMDKIKTLLTSSLDGVMLSLRWFFPYSALFLFFLVDLSFSRSMFVVVFSFSCSGLSLTASLIIHPSLSTLSASVFLPSCFSLLSFLLSWRLFSRYRSSPCFSPWLSSNLVTGSCSVPSFLSIKYLISTYHQKLVVLSVQFVRLRHHCLLRRRLQMLWHRLVGQRKHFNCISFLVVSFEPLSIEITCPVFLSCFIHNPCLLYVNRLEKRTQGYEPAKKRTD